MSVLDGTTVKNIHAEEDEPALVYPSFLCCDTAAPALRGTKETLRVPRVQLLAGCSCYSVRIRSVDGMVVGWKVPSCGAAEGVDPIIIAVHLLSKAT